MGPPSFVKSVSLIHDICSENMEEVYDDSESRLWMGYVGDVCVRNGAS